MKLIKEELCNRVGHKNEKLHLANGTFIFWCLLGYKFRNFFFSQNLKIIIFTYQEIYLKNNLITIWSEKIKFRILPFSDYIDLALTILRHMVKTAGLYLYWFLSYGTFYIQINLFTTKRSIWM